MSCSDTFICGFAAVWAILQTCLHLSWSIWGMQFYECKLIVRNETLAYLWYLTYFYDKSCINSSTQSIFGLVAHQADITTTVGLLDSLDKVLHPYSKDINAGTKLSDIELKLPEESSQSARTYNIFRNYAILDAMWMIISIALLIGSSFRIKGKQSIAICILWLAALLFFLVYDGITAGLYVYNIKHTNGFSKWFKFIGGENQSSIDELDDRYSAVAFTMPSIIMALVCSRFVVVWMVNLVLFLRMSQVSFNLLKLEKVRNTLEIAERNVHVNDSQTEVCNHDSVTVRIRRWREYYGTNAEEINDDQKVQKSTCWPSNKQKRHEIVKNNTPSVSQELAVISGYSDMSNTKSPVLNKSTNHDAEIWESKRCVNYVGDLKGQLPWSYFNNRTCTFLPKNG